MYADFYDQKLLMLIEAFPKWKFLKFRQETVFVTSGRISMIAPQNIEFPLNGRLSFAPESFSATQCSNAAAPARMSVYKQAPYYYYYY